MCLGDGPGRPVASWISIAEGVGVGLPTLAIGADRRRMFGDKDLRSAVRDSGRTGRRPLWDGTQFHRSCVSEFLVEARMRRSPLREQ